jgi:hypothetical protein
MKMFTKHVTKHLSAYCNGELLQQESLRVRDHLLSCKRCRDEHAEITFGVSLAQQLPLAAAPADMWSEIEALLDQQSRRPVPQPSAGRLVPAFNWYRLAAFGALLLVAVAIGLMWPSRTVHKEDTRARWTVESFGSVRIDGSRIKHTGSIAVGETLETGDSSGATISVATIGEVKLDPNSRMRLVRTAETEHRIAFERGKMSATIKAPPRLFFVDTVSAQAIDLGCAYALEVDDQGRGLLQVTSGWVELAGNGHESYVPIGARCKSRPGVGPGTPYFSDASDVFVQALESFDFEGGASDAFSTVLRESRARDTFTLWQMLSRVEGDQRVQVLDRMIELVGLPHGITRAGTLKLDQKTLDDWKDAMDLVWF